MKKWMALILAAVMLTGCGTAEEAPGDLMVNVEQGSELTAAADPEMGKITDFAVELLKNSYNETQNVTVSPLSVLAAMSMTANGAKGETLSQMESVLGASAEQLSGWFLGWKNREDESLRLANAIWFRDDPALSVQQDFLQTNADYFGAGAFKAAFDEETAKTINRWVEDNTDGRIDGIIDEIPEDAMLYLINALAFEAKWEEPYEEAQIRSGDFYTAGGAVQTDFMYSTEYAYLEGADATGFIRYYEGGNYAFAALLPHEDVTVEEFLECLDGETLHAILTSPQDIETHAVLPQFRAEYDVELSEVLQSMGITDAFDWQRADLSGMAVYEGEGVNLCIDRVLHKTYLAVDAEGTQAGAATAVEVVAEGMAEPVEFRTVRLDRPFVYMILDCETGFPVFLGTMTDPTQKAVSGEPVGVKDHTHAPAENDQTAEHEEVGYCGNILTTVEYDGKESTFMGSDSVYLTDLLTYLDYDPEKLCKCLPEITVTLESGAVYGISLSGYARNEVGQADLTEEQLQRVREILENLK